MNIPPSIYGLHCPGKTPGTFVMPPAYRYMKKEYVDRFFDTGELRIPTMISFWEHDGDVFRDETEGNVLVIVRAGGKTAAFVTQIGRDCYVLCGSTMLSKELSKRFGGLDHAIQINDHHLFINEVCSKISGCRNFMAGPALYTESGYIDIDGDEKEGKAIEELIERFPHLLMPKGQLIEERALNMPDEIHGFIAQTLYNPHILFKKNIDYAADYEYRYIWSTGRNVGTDAIYVKVPDARKYCNPIKVHGV